MKLNFFNDFWIIENLLNFFYLKSMKDNRGSRMTQLSPAFSRIVMAQQKISLYKRDVIQKYGKVIFKNSYIQRSHTVPTKHMFATPKNKLCTINIFLVNSNASTKILNKGDELKLKFYYFAFHRTKYLCIASHH